jgi:uncharacterized repeat protein (TIGR01451 family)
MKTENNKGLPVWLKTLHIFLLSLLVLTLHTASPVRAAGLADLIVEKSHTGDFTQNEQGKTYTIKVKNQGDDPTDGSIVTVVDTLPTGLTATAIAGTGWSCVLNTLTCTRSDVLASQVYYPDITLTVNVAPDSPLEVTNTVTVSGGGDSDLNNNTALDVTTIIGVADLIVTGYELLNTSHAPISATTLEPYEPFSLRVKVKNRGGADSGGVFYSSVYIDRDPNTYTITDPEGCLYNSGIDENDWGDYRKENLLGALPPFTEDTETFIVDIPDGLSAGAHQIWFYADPTCVVQGESFENNNAYGPYNITISASTLTVASSGAYDGWIQESTETSGKGSKMNNGAGFLYMGDDALDRQYLSILSFNTTSLPDNAVITSVYLKFKFASITGTNPFVTHGLLFADFKKGSFSNNVTLSIFDFKAPANRNRAMSITNGNLKSNNWYSQMLTSNYFKLINKAGITQVRLRFARDDDNDNRADMLLIHSGNSTSANRPKLIINYYVP